MWSVPGKAVDVDRFKPFQPLRVLYDFDGPKTFTYQDQEGELFLAHWCDEDQNVARYLVVPFSKNLVQRVESGQMTLRQALDQPRLWVVDVNHDGNLQTAWRADLSKMPDDALPKPGTMLLPSLERDKTPR